MIRRHSHTAKITVEVDGRLEHGEWIKGNKQEFIVKGQFFPDNSGRQRKTNADGDEFIVKGEFSHPAQEDQRGNPILRSRV